MSFTLKRSFAAAQCLALLLCVAGDVRGHGSAPTPGGLVARRTAKRRRGKARAKMSESAKGARVTGNWGGAHVRLDAREGGASLEFDCARGEIGEPFETGADGRFDLPGTLTREGPGPIRIGRTPGAQSVRYVGRVEGRGMTLAVRLVANDQTLETYTLARGSEGRLWKCR